MPELFLRYQLGNKYNVPFWEVDDWPTKDVGILLELIALESKLEATFPLTPQKPPQPSGPVRVGG